jgi:hypothetical protein
MLKRLVLLVAVVCLGTVLAAPSNAATAKPKTRSYSISFLTASLPQVPGTAAGVATGTLGKGAILIVGNTSGTATEFLKKGAVTVKFRLTVTTNPDMSASFTGTTTITGGTGAYAGAKGKGTVSGTFAVDGSATGRGSGKITY